ncbi:hypothetical protein DXG01_001944 [Tephrocybe rancida]|nr:hypothetical protein DXG01_001944 [Tephrocybe rancida]
MHGTHLDNPLHCIEAWTGEYFCKAELWEVGCYVVVPHAGDIAPICQALEVQMMYLESFQRHRDTQEQKFLREHNSFPIVAGGTKKASLSDIKVDVDQGIAGAGQLGEVQDGTVYGTMKGSDITGSLASTEGPSMGIPHGNHTPRDAAFNTLELDDAYMK